MVMTCWQGNYHSTDRFIVRVIKGRQVNYNGNDRLIMILMTGQQINDIRKGNDILAG